MNKHAIVKLDQVSKYYQEGASRRLVLDRVSAELRSGELVVIQGRSGSGKTTLLNLIAGLDVPDAGAVMVDGKAIHALTEHERTLFRRRHLGFVFQFFNLVGTLTVAENMRFSLDLNGFPAAETQARVEALLQDMGIADRGGSFPDRLSGGEQQRVALARALAHRPRLVLADEPTGNLDIETERTILALLKDLPRRHQATVVVATHSEEVANTADRVLSLRNGTLVERQGKKRP